MRGNYKSFKETKLTVVDGIHQLSCISCQSYNPCGKGGVFEGGERSNRFRSHRCILVGSVLYA